MVLRLQMGAKTSPTVLGFLIELPALGCLDGQLQEEEVVPQLV